MEKKFFIECFRGFETIEIKKNINDYSFVEKFDFIFNNIIINNQINQIINDVIKPLATKKYNI